MGDAISPGITIITLAYMEHCFLADMLQQERILFHGIRYMDDVLTIYKENSTARGVLERIQHSDVLRRSEAGTSR